MGYTLLDASNMYKPSQELAPPLFARLTHIVTTSLFTGQSN